MKFILDRGIFSDRNKLHIALERLRPLHPGWRIFCDQTIAVGTPVVEGAGNESPRDLTGRIISEGYRNLTGGKAGNSLEHDEDTHSEPY